MASTLEGQRFASFSKAVRPKFGSQGAGAVAVPVMSKLFHTFETSYQPGFILLSKITANVIPRVALCRNWEERKEVSFNEVTQGATLFALLPVTSYIGDRFQSFFAGKKSGITTQLLKMENSKAIAEVGEGMAQKLRTAKLGKSIGASAFIAAMLIATTYLRNYRTIKKTGFSDYKKVIGLGGNQEPTPEEKIAADKALRRNANLMKGLFVGGVAAWLASMAGAGAIIRNGGKILKEGGLFNPVRLKDWMKHWAFVGKNSNQINGVFNSTKQTLWVWGVPSYAGWLAGCRDKYEVVEQFSKFATFCMGYIAVGRIVNKIMSWKDKGLLKKFGKLGSINYTNVLENVSKKKPSAVKPLIKHMNQKWLLLFGINFLFAGVAPIIFNIFFSKWRHARENEQPLIQQPQLTGLTQRKTFNQWAQSTYS